MQEKLEKEYVDNSELLIHAAKRKEDSSIISSIWLKFDDKLVVDFSSFVHLVNLKLFCQFHKSKQKQFHIHNL